MIAQAYVLVQRCRINVLSHKTFGEACKTLKMSIKLVQRVRNFTLSAHSVTRESWPAISRSASERTHSGNCSLAGSIFPHRRVTTLIAECSVSRCICGECMRTNCSAEANPPASNTAAVSREHINSNTFMHCSAINMCASIDEQLGAPKSRPVRSFI